MNLSEPFIRRPVMTLLITFSIFLFGLVAYSRLSVSDLPNVDIPSIEVTVSYPGANPETMAQSIAVPLEKQFMAIPVLKNLFSTSSTGATSIVLQFDLKANLDGASTDVQAAISRAQPELPSDLPNNPTYEKVNPSLTPILYLALYSDTMTAGELYDYAATFIGRRLSMLEGVAKVNTYGSPFAVRVQVDPEKLAAKQIGIDQVAETVQNGNVQRPLGVLWGARDDYTIDADGQLKTASPYGELVIKQNNGTYVKIKDIGTPLDSVQNDKFYYTHVTKEGTRSSIILAIQKLPGANTIQVVQRVYNQIDNLRPQLPENLTIDPVYDASLPIIEGVQDVKFTLLLSFILVVAIVYLFLGKAANTAIPAIVLPLSILGTCALMYLYGYSINILSLLAFILCMGFLIDDAIVVLENSVRHVQLGSTPFEAAIQGAKEIGQTVLSMSLCLSAAFIPMVFMGGVMGRLFQEFAITLVTAVLLSGLLSLTLTPLLCSRFVSSYSANKGRLESLSLQLTEKMKAYYEPLLRRTLHRPLFVLTLGAASIGLTALFYFLLPQDFLPPDDVGFIQGYTQARDGTSPFLMNQYHEEINRIAIQDPNVDSIISYSSYSNSNQGEIFFRLKPYKQRQPMNRVIKTLSEKMAQIPGVNCYFSSIPLINFQVGTTSQALYEYTLSSLNSEQLHDYAPKLVSKLRSSPHFSQVSSDLLIQQPLWSLHILRDRAAQFGLQASDIEQFLTLAYSDNKISQINGATNTYHVLIETMPRFYQDPTVLSKLYIRSPSTSALVPLSEVVEPKETIGPVTINHVNGLPAVTISFNPSDQISLGQTLQTLHTLSQDKPHEIGGEVIGTAQVFQDSFASLPLLVLLTLFTIYAILGILYESFLHPLTVMSALPPALVSGLFTLYLFGQTLSLYSFVGLILLMGIVLKNGIMMVDFAIVAMREEKKSVHDAIIEASLIRFRPIIMTTLAALMGAVPLALGIGGAMAKSTISLGLCVVGGLLISQVVTLLLTPVIFSTLEGLRERIYKK